MVEILPDEWGGAAASFSPLHRLEEGGVPLQDPIGLIWIGRQIGNVAFERSPQKDAVVAWNHVQRLAIDSEDVVDLRLRQQDRHLPFCRDEFLVAKEFSRAQTGAIDYRRFGQLTDLLHVAKLAYDDTPSRGSKVELDRPHISRRLNQHGCRAAGIFSGKGVLARAERGDPWEKFAQAVKETRRCTDLVIREIAVNPPDAVV